MISDPADGTFFYLTDRALLSVSANGTSALVAGNPKQAGFVDGPRSESHFYSPRSMVLDAKNKCIYVADTGNNALRLVNLSSGRVSTMAGVSAEGYVEGIGPAARFRGPLDIVLSPDGTLYVSDWGNGRIRSVRLSTEQGCFVTALVAGCGQHGFLNGPAALARFGIMPIGLALDHHGDIIVADSANDMIRKICLSACIGHPVVETVSGLLDQTELDGGRLCNGNVTEARFHRPIDVVVDPNGNFIVADRDNHIIRVIAHSVDIVATIAGTTPSPPEELSVNDCAEGGASSARFAKPTSLFLDHTGTLYVLCSENHSRISRIEYGSATGPALLAKCKH